MKILDGEKWQDDFLDQTLRVGFVRIRVAVWKNLGKIDDIYFIRRKSLRMILNYLKEIGLRNVLIKILARSRERLRNEKYISCGFGYVEETDGNNQSSLNQPVIFLAPSHPKCMERVVLSTDLVRPVKEIEGFLSYKGQLVYLPVQEGTEFINKKLLDTLSGWSEFSGEEIPREALNEILDETDHRLKNLGVNKQVTCLDISTATACREYQGDAGPQNKTRHRKKACLFGYGNYAKTIILPNIKDFVDMDCIHEIDPTQMAGIKNCRMDTSPVPRADEAYDVYFIASYHHSHVPLAIHALKQNAYAVVEKPIVTTREQLDALLAAGKHSSGAIFSCFNRRYSIFNDYAREDLSLTQGAPVSYHCIIYEVPLPKLHWYRWGNSQSRLVSNGCHWVDHFLYLNDFAPVSWSDVVESGNGTVNVSVELENGAFFSMVLSDIGSERTGVREYVELRNGGATAKIIDGSNYLSENSHGIIRRKRINRLSMYGDMYRRIAEKIDRGSEGDSYKSIELSSGLVLDLEDKLIEYRKRINERIGY